MAKGNMKAIKRRIKSVTSTLQITKAMEMVASSKLHRAKIKAETIRPYFMNLYESMSEIAAENIDFNTVYTRKREVKKRLFIVIAGDRGLAGGYNANVLKKVLNDLTPEEKAGEKPKIIAIGKKSIEFFEKRKYEFILKYPDFLQNVKASSCAEMANTAAELFKSGEVDEVKVFYTTYVSALSQEPSEITLLPITDISDENEEKNAAHKISMTEYDPSPEAVFDRIVPKYMLSAINCACVESYASEQCARRIAMENASDNAEEMITSLSLEYNRARQEKITNEINEIVAGANAI